MNENNMTHYKQNQVSEKDIIMVVSIAVAIVLVFFFYVNFIPKTSSSSKITLDIIKINGCNNCFDLALLDPIIQQIENIEIKSDKSFDYNSKEAEELIKKYNIKSIPSMLIISKKIDELTLDETMFRKEKNAAIFDKAVPYIDLKSEEIRGVVNITEIYDPSCAECRSFSAVKAQFEQSGVKIDEYLRISSSLNTGQELIKNNSITYLPALLISKDIKEYWWIFNGLENSVVETEDYYRVNEPVFPYKDLLTNQIKGKVALTYLVNRSCEECFNITQLKSSFQGNGIYIESENYADVADSEGKNLLIKYNITAIPTLIFSEELLDYTQIKDILESVGTFEADNSYVLRALDKLNVNYQKL